MSELEMKRCTKCGEEKIRSDFYKQSGKRDGLQPACKACNNAAHHIARKRRAQTAREEKLAWVEANRETIAQRRREASRQRLAEWRMRHPDRAKELASAWRRKNRTKERMRYSRYARENPLKMAEKNHRRRARQHAGGSFTKDEILGLGKMQKWRCVSCRGSIKQKFHIDHVVPLAAGGRNTIDNLQLLCPSCNHSKSARDPIEFMQSRGFLL